MSTLPKAPLTPERYLEIERKAEFKSEYYNGEMFAMSGGSRAHSRLAFRLAALLDPHLEKKGCEGNTADLRVFVESAGLYTYPDLSVVCGEPKFADGQMDVLLNPGPSWKFCRRARNNMTAAREPRSIGRFHR